MECSRCDVRRGRRGELQVFWSQVPNADKRVFVTVLLAAAGAAAGWAVAGFLGLLIGAFLAGCLGGMTGLAMYGDAPGEARSKGIEGGMGRVETRHRSA